MLMLHIELLDVFSNHIAKEISPFLFLIYVKVLAHLLPLELLSL